MFKSAGWNKMSRRRLMPAFTCQLWPWGRSENLLWWTGSLEPSSFATFTYSPAAASTLSENSMIQPQISDNGHIQSKGPAHQSLQAWLQSGDSPVSYGPSNSLPWHSTNAPLATGRLKKSRVIIRLLYTPSSRFTSPEDLSIEHGQRRAS